MTNYMKTPSQNGGPPAPRKSGKPEPGSREARLAEALRANLRRRKAAAKPAGGATATETPAAAETAPEKPGKPS